MLPRIYKLTIFNIWLNINSFLLKIITLQEKYIKQKENSAPGIQLAFQHKVGGVMYEGTFYVSSEGNVKTKTRAQSIYKRRFTIKY